MELIAYLTARKPDGELIYRVKARSFVGNMSALLRKTINDATQAQAYTDTSNVGQNFPNAPPSQGCNAGVGIDTFGIQIGSSSQVVVITDYKLVAPIVNANVSYGLTSISALVAAGTKKSFTVARTFTNVGIAQTVREVSLVITPTGATYCLLDRSIVPDYALAPAAIVSYAYEIGITV